MSLRICQSVGDMATLELLSTLPSERRPDLVELRLDLLGVGAADGATLGSLIERLPVPVIATCRPAWEGGAYRGEEGSRRALLQRALPAGAVLVDVEVAADWAAEFLACHGGETLLSHHWQEPDPVDLDSMLRRMLDARPAVAKLVAPARAPGDAVSLLRAGRRLSSAGVTSACFCLGDGGRASRLLAAASAGGLLYAAGGATIPTAAGQWDLDYLLAQLRAREWRSGQRLFGVIGDPIDGSLSPTVFNAAFASEGAAAAYLLLPGSPAEAMLELAADSGVEGLSVTMPFKSEVIGHCAELSAAARQMGAVNTLVRRGGRWLGDNTDGAAVVDVLGAHGELHGRRCAVLGAGGAGRAAAAALHGAGARVTVLNRTIATAQRLAARLGVECGSPGMLQRTAFDIIVQATPVGMNGTTETPIPTVWLKGTEVVLDMVYRPLTTAFLAAAAERGCRTISGLEMFLRQAALQHRLWFGEDAPVDVMRHAATRRLDTSGGTKVR